MKSPKTLRTDATINSCRVEVHSTSFVSIPWTKGAFSNKPRANAALSECEKMPIACRFCSSQRPQRQLPRHFAPMRLFSGCERRLAASICCLSRRPNAYFLTTIGATANPDSVKWTSDKEERARGTLSSANDISPRTWTNFESSPTYRLREIEANDKPHRPDPRAGSGSGSLRQV